MRIVVIVSQSADLTHHQCRRAQFLDYTRSSCSSVHLPETALTCFETVTATPRQAPDRTAGHSIAATVSTAKEGAVSRRIYLVVPDTEQCRGVVSRLLAAGLRARDLQAMAAWWVDLTDLPRANPWRTTELLSGLLTGACVGGASGFAAILLAVMFPAGSTAVGALALPVAAIAGAGYGSLLGGLISIRVPKREFGAFKHNLLFGQIVLLLDVPENRTRQILAVLNTHCRDAFYTVPLRPTVTSPRRAVSGHD